MKILLAEDDNFQQVVVKHIIESLGHQVDVVDNGKYVLDRLIDETYDLILMDIEMPIMDGYEAAMQVKQVEPSLPIVAMTTIMSGNRVLKDETNFDLVLEKPISKEKLSLALKNLLER